MECKLSDSSDESSGSLPDLADVFNVKKSSQSKQSTEITKGDIVWARFRHLYWPALVRSVYPKQKKITIWYADEPGKTFKLPLKHVHRFNDNVMRAKIIKDVREAGCYQAHEGLTTHAMRYLVRRYEGYQDDPMKFFDQTYPFFLVEELRKKDPNADISDLKIPPLYISHEKKQNIRKRYCPQIEVSDESEVESISSEDVSEKNVGDTDYLTTVNKKLQENPYDPSKDEYSNELVEVILSGQADDHLQKVLSKKIHSQYRVNYEKSKSCRVSMKNETFTGPIEDDNLLRKIIFYLLPLYDNMKSKKAGSSKQKRCKKKKTTATEYSSFDGKSDEALYVSSVWLPEAIIFAISKVKNISVCEAKELFSLKSESKTKALENIISSLDTISQENELPSPTLRKVDSAESSDDQSCSNADSETKASKSSGSPKKLSSGDSDMPGKTSKLSKRKRLGKE